MFPDEVSPSISQMEKEREDRYREIFSRAMKTDGLEDFYKKKVADLEASLSEKMQTISDLNRKMHDQEKESTGELERSAAALARERADKAAVEKKCEDRLATVAAENVRYGEEAASWKKKYENLVEYIRLKQKLDSEKDYRNRKKLLDQIRSISDDNLPEISLPQVTARLSAHIDVVGGLLNKKKVLKFSVTLNPGEKLPCDAELHIATKTLTSVDDYMCCSFRIPKGTSGTFSDELQLPNVYVDPKKTIYLYLFPDKNAVDRNAIKADFIYVKQ